MRRAALLAICAVFWFVFLRVGIAQQSTGSFDQTVTRRHTLGQLTASPLSGSVVGSTIDFGLLLSTGGAPAPVTEAVQFFDGSTVLGTAQIASVPASNLLPDSHLDTTTGWTTVGIAPAITPRASTGADGGTHNASTIAFPGGYSGVHLDVHNGVSYAGLPMTFSFWAKSAIGASLQVDLSDGSSSASDSTTCSVGTRWQLCSFTVVLPQNASSGFGVSITTSETTAETVAISLLDVVQADAPGAYVSTIGVARTTGAAGGTAAFQWEQFLAGQHSITAQYGGDLNFVASTSNAIVFRVDKGTPSVSVTDTPAATSVYGRSVTLSATVTGPVTTPTGSVTFFDGGVSMGTVQLSSGAASITRAGTESLLAGTHTITVAYSGDDNFVSVVSSPLIHTVTKAEVALSLTSSPNPSVFGDTVTFGFGVSSALGIQPTGSVQFLDGGQVTLGSPTLDATGTGQIKTTSLTAGTHTVEVTYSGDSNYFSKQQQLSQVVNQVTPSLTWNTPNQITYGTALSNKQLNASATGLHGTSLQGIFTYIPAAGSIPSAGIQTLSVTFTPSDSLDYKSVSMQVPLAVQKAMPILTWATPASIPYGTPLSATQLDAVATSINGEQIAGTFAYTPSSGLILSVGSHKLSVMFTPTDTTNYASASATVAIIVVSASPTLSWATPQAITYGTLLSNTQLNARAYVGDSSISLAGTYAYTPASGAMLTAGSHVLTVVFTPSDTANYATATKSVSLQVNKATPPAAWTNPNPITTGTSLGSVQLNASSSLQGTFAYAPGAGAVLATGIHTLGARFEPSDSSNYTSADVSVTLRVTDFALSTKTPDAHVVAYGSGTSVQTTLALDSLTQFSGNVGLHCLNVPSTMGCVFAQSLVPLGPEGAMTNLTITTTPRTVTYTGMIFFFGGISVFWAVRRRHGMAYGIFSLVIVLLAITELNGCAGNSRYTQYDGTPKGTYTITVVATSGNLTHSVPVTVIVK
jgi:hypothetical protein